MQEQISIEIIKLTKRLKEKEKVTIK